MILNREYVRQSVLMVVDASLFVISFLLALALAGREVEDIHYKWFEYVWMIAILLAVKLFVFLQTGFYKEVIRFISMGFAAKVVKATIFGSLISISLIHIVRREIEMPVLVIDWMASCILIGMSRFGLRYIQEGRLSKTAGKNTILYGAGEHGAAVARHLILNDKLGYRVVGFIDDSPDKCGKKIHGITVAGDIESLPQEIKMLEAEEVVVTFTNPDGDLVKRVFRTCREHGVRCRIVPGMNDVIAGGEVVRNIDIADLMRRPQHTLDKEMVSNFLRGQRVMITGAAGSIGSEIFRQVLTFAPEAVAALDHSEYALYRLDEEFAAHSIKGKCFFTLVDIKIPELVSEAMRQFRPDVVFHAAAYKHVPLLERDVRQAVFNNVKGLQNVVNAATDNNVSMFVFISTDKAVRPTNVMGATKRIGECIVQAANGRNGMRCVSVRFGNVLASSGSVVPKFMEQIKGGGPVTVTHPDVTRYFMLIPEAVELVLQAASLGKGGEVLVLDMGKPVRITEMAEDLISLMGHVPHTGIPIVYTGLRPGEKLHEELFLDEINCATQFKEINVGKVTPVDELKLKRNLAELLRIAEIDGDAARLRSAIREIVPEYREAK